MAELNQMTSKIKIGFGKGRGFQESFALFNFYQSPDLNEFAANSGTVCCANHDDIVCVKVRQSDLAWMLERNYLDIAIGSSIWFVNNESFQLQKALGLNIKQCRLSLIARKNINYVKIFRVATRFPSITKAFFDKMNIRVDILPMEGCHEVALALGFADAIVDIIETGNTIKKMGLVEIETLLHLEHEIWVRKDNPEMLGRLKKLLLKDTQRYQRNTREPQFRRIDKYIGPEIFRNL